MDSTYDAGLESDEERIVVEYIPQARRNKNKSKLIHKLNDT